LEVPSRLRWRCRRGTKELDIILLRFLDTEYSRISAEEQGAFESLLNEQDPDLAGWLWGGKAPPSKWKPLIERIRRSAGIVPHRG